MEKTKNKISDLLKSKQLKYGVAGFLTIGASTLAGITYEESKHGIEFLVSLSDLHHYLTPAAIGLAGGIAGAVIGYEKEKLLDSYQKLKESEERYKELSKKDGLTGLFNHKQFYEDLENEIKRANRFNHPLSLLLFDVDNFKGINDKYGHVVGDGILSEIGQILNAQARSGIDVPARYGGDEFAILLPETNIQNALSQGERILFEVNNDKSKGVTISIGASQYSFGESVKSFIERTDKNLYMAKKHGKNRIFYNDLVASV